MTEESPHNGGTTPQSVLFMTRAIWASLLMGELAIVGVAAFDPLGRGGEDRSVPLAISGLSVAMMLTAIPFGLYLRRRLFRGNTTAEGTVQPAAYQTGSIIALATCEGTAVVALLAALVGGSLIPYALPALIPLLVQLWLWPDGRELFAASS